MAVDCGACSGYIERVISLPTEESAAEENARLRAELADSRRQVEALRGSERKYRTLHDTLIDAYVRVDMTGRIIEFNDSYQHMLGYSRDELLDRCYEELTPPSWHRMESAIIESQVLTRGHSDIYEKEYRRKDGTIIPVELRTVLVRDADGTPSGMWAIVRDITARTRIEQSLRESQSWLTSAIQVAAVGLYRQEGPAANRTTFLDHRARVLLGIPREQEHRTHSYWVEHIHRDDLQRVGEVSEAFESGGIDRAEVDYRFSRGPRDVVWIRHVAHAMERDAAGRATLVIGILQDVTVHKQVEVALRDSEERFRHVAESVSDFIWEVDADGLYRYTSPSVEQILGYRPEEIVGLKHFYDLFLEEDREERTAAAFAVFAERGTFRAFSGRYVAKDGRVVILHTSGGPVVDASGSLLGYRGADTDVTERWLAEQGLRNLSRRLLVVQEEERTRVARELHDGLCQTLALLSIKLDVFAQSPPRLAADRRASLHELSEQVKRLTEDVRRVSHDLHPIRLELLGLEATIRGLCKEVSATCALTVTTDLAAASVEAPYAVAVCLFRVVQEALQNVVKHSHATCASVTVTPEDGGLRMVVADNGHGFDTQAPLVTASAGLANMRERVHVLGGRFVVDSRPGAGTRIEVHVPCPSAGAEAPAAITAPPDAVSPARAQEIWGPPATPPSRRTSA
jgi:PAS domain S-box-containing protein